MSDLQIVEPSPVDTPEILPHGIENPSDPLLLVARAIDLQKEIFCMVDPTGGEMAINRHLNAGLLSKHELCLAQAAMKSERFKELSAKLSALADQLTAVEVNHG